MKKVFVTGITGLLGANVVIKLLQDGYFVIALVRKKNGYLGEKNKNLKLIEASLFSDVSEYLKDVHYVIHIAAETQQNLLSYENYKKINYDAAVHLFSHSEEARVKKFLFVSSANTLGFGRLGDLGNENTPQKYPFTHSFYAKSKLEAENFLLKNNQKTKVVILNPTFMIGAYDHKPSSGKIIFWVWNKKIVFYPEGGKNFVHVEDVAAGILKALEKGQNGEKYILANENLKYKSFFKKVNKLTQQNPIMIPIPDIILRILGLAGDFLRVFEMRTSLSSVNMKALQIDNFYSNKKSIEKLAIEYQSIEKAIEDAVLFFENQKKNRANF
ncbi:dihydroflavonol 4-reductase [Chryseobacterium sp. FH2]|uniref:NAD-dependent epimerase/dehydratase family protein n=1 Tax=Chryseobacterium sp. FH2 TaxID=1674291 RepID=UPI00065AA3CB|nr:NAD-dependent epimerase/dehydratase family protein [Chryseobacterium sp. FH2]KMQ69002.1 dihydroflavonol 4-reductase [Chryseobacterium sp. FH2]